MAPNHALPLLDDRTVPQRPGEVRACMVVRNESLRLPSTLAHYRQLGVDRFLVIDNGSDDGTLEFLRGQPDIHVFLTTDSFAESQCGLTWTNAILDAFCDGQWTMTIDADELFIYPHVGQVGIHRFCRFLDSVGHKAVISLLLDMYSDKPLAETVHPPGGSLVATCPYFDSGPYQAVQVQAFPAVQFYGGVRQRLFKNALGGRYPAPTVSKVPLVKWRAGTHYLLATHAMTPVVLSDLIAALLHFKFLDDFPLRAVTEARRGEHFDGASEYRAYVELVEQGWPVPLHAAESMRFEDADQLVRLGLMRSSPAYEQFLGAPTAG